MRVKVFEQKDRSITTIVNDIIEQAISIKASDIHLEPTENDLRVRYRVDGVLIPQGLLPAAFALQLISHIKVLAHIDISEKRVPQDGKFQFLIAGNSIDLRVSTFPSIYGEKVVIRILDARERSVALEQLGLSEILFEQFNSLIGRSSGFILVTGPTGCGKTTTLYAALSHINAPDKNIITLEDPVEYHIDGITQGQIHPEAGFTFVRGMRSLLRQDPDIALIGEIRDKESAQIAIEAALTGHLVLSTLHTTNAPSAIMRLMDMGIEPFLINASITGVMAQRLARRLCLQCRYEVEPSADEQKILKKLKLSLKKIWKARGCSACSHVGYKGRIGLFELLMVTPALHSLIVQQPLYDVIYAQSCTDGMKTLMQDGIEKLRCGLISLEELVRVVL